MGPTMDTIGQLQRILVAVMIFIVLGISGPEARSDSALRNCKLIRDGVGTIVEFGTTTAEGGSAIVSGMLVKPQARGSHPAIVLLHRYFGLEEPDCFRSEIERYRSWGYAVLLVDSNSAPPEVRSGTSGETLTNYDFTDQAADGLGAVAFLSSLPDVRGKSIFMVGHAYGGSAVLRASSKAIMAPRMSGRYPQLRNVLTAAVAWHPSCPERLQGIGVPLLVITGSDDKLNSFHACKVMDVDVLPGVDEPVHATFDGSGHNFDVDWLAEYDADATEAAYDRIARFLTRSR